MSLELETCNKCRVTYVFPGKHVCKSREERDCELNNRWARETERGSPLSASQAYHLANLED